MKDRDLLKEIEGLELGIKRKDAQIVTLKEWHDCEVYRAENKQTIIDSMKSSREKIDQLLKDQKNEVQNAIGIIMELQKQIEILKNK